MKIFQLSDYYNLLFSQLKFVFIVIGRFFKVLFRKNRQIILLRLNYSHKYLFDKSYLIVKYRFKNALWYTFSPIKNTTEKEVMVFNLQNVPSSEIKMSVRGFFRSRTFLLPIPRENTIDTKTFIPRIRNINGQIDFTKPFGITISAPSVNIPDILTNTQQKAIFQQPYNQSEYL
jgi:hypothetical protein